MRKRLIIALALLAVIAAACGDDSSIDTSVPTIATTAAGEGTTAAGEVTTTAGAGGSLTCDGLLSLDEVASLFGEPAVLDTETSTATTCSWTTVEDPENLEDIEVQLLLVQVYQGSAYYAPEMVYPDAEPLSGIGEAAFVNAADSVSTGCLDGDLVVFVDYAIILSTASASEKKDQVIELLRLVHDRVG